MINDIEIPLSSEEKKILSIVERHKGKENAIPKDLLSEISGYPERKCRRIIKALIEIHNVPIGSEYGGSGMKGGYFLADDPEEMKKVYRRLRKHGISILVRAAAIRGITLRRLLHGIQRELF